MLIRSHAGHKGYEESGALSPKNENNQKSSFFPLCMDELCRSKGGGFGITTVSGIPDEKPMIIFAPSDSNSRRPPILNESHFHIR